MKWRAKQPSAIGPNRKKKRSNFSPGITSRGALMAQRVHGGDMERNKNR